MVWMARAAKQAYPQIDAFIKTDIANLYKKSRVFNAWLKWCKKGGMVWPTAWAALAYGHGPQLRIENLVSNRGGVTNGKFRRATPNAIYLDKPIAVRFKRDSRRRKAKLLVESTILHELVHWADWTADRRKYRAEGEIGKEFEKEAYGQNINRYF